MKLGKHFFILLVAANLASGAFATSHDGSADQPVRPMLPPTAPPGVVPQPPAPPVIPPAVDDETPVRPMTPPIAPVFPPEVAPMPRVVAPAPVVVAPAPHVVAPPVVHGPNKGPIFFPIAPARNAEVAPAPHLPGTRQEVTKATPYSSDATDAKVNDLLAKIRTSRKSAAVAGAAVQVAFEQALIAQIAHLRFMDQATAKKGVEKALALNLDDAKKQAKLLKQGGYLNLFHLADADSVAVSAVLGQKFNQRFLAEAPQKIAEAKAQIAVHALRSKTAQNDINHLPPIVRNTKHGKEAIANYTKIKALADANVALFTNEAAVYKTLQTAVKKNTGKN